MFRVPVSRSLHLESHGQAVRRATERTKFAPDTLNVQRKSGEAWMILGRICAEVGSENHVWEWYDGYGASRRV